jgi:hypothetical protein
VLTDFQKRAAKKNIKPPSLAMSVEFAAEEIIKQVIHCKRVHVFDLKYGLGAFFLKLLPFPLRSRILSRSIQYKS